jgi:hypothetical protein
MTSACCCKLIAARSSWRIGRRGRRKRSVASRRRTTPSTSTRPLPRAARNGCIADLASSLSRYKESVASRDGAWAERQKALEEEKQRIFDRISAEVTAKQREQEEFLELQIVLSMQEAEEKRVREDKARAEKRLRDRVEMMAANEHQKVRACRCCSVIATPVC